MNQLMELDSPLHNIDPDPKYTNSLNQWKSSI